MDWNRWELSEQTTRILTWRLLKGNHRLSDKMGSSMTQERGFRNESSCSPSSSRLEPYRQATRESYPLNSIVTARFRFETKKNRHASRQAFLPSPFVICNGKAELLIYLGYHRFTLGIRGMYVTRFKLPLLPHWPSWKLLPRFQKGIGLTVTTYRDLLFSGCEGHF